MIETRNEMSNTTQIQPAAGYAGDVPAELAWQWLQAGEAVLVDVRTDAEYQRKQNELRKALIRNWKGAQDAEAPTE